MFTGRLFRFNQIYPHVDAYLVQGGRRAAVVSNTLGAHTDALSSHQRLGAADLNVCASMAWLVKSSRQPKRTSTLLAACIFACVRDFAAAFAHTGR